VYINPLPVQFKSVLHWQEGCVFFSGHLNVRKYHYALVRLGRQRVNLLCLIYVLQPHITIFMYLFVDCTMTSSISLCAPPLVLPVISRGAPRQATRETSVSEGRNWAINDRSIWPAIQTST
jgi:hypothetical protein